MWKTGGGLDKHARRPAKGLAIGLIAAIALVSAATPFLEGRFYERWFGWPGVLASAQMPLLVAITAFALLRSIKGGRDWLPSYSRSSYSRCRWRGWRSPSVPTLSREESP